MLHQSSVEIDNLPKRKPWMQIPSFLQVSYSKAVGSSITELSSKIIKGVAYAIAIAYITTTNQVDFPVASKG